jgi:peptidoglycan/LPS O-acetylase OafA/YrhL
MGRIGERDLAVRPSWGRRLVGIEGLRGIAAVSVLVHHVTIRLADEDKIGQTATKVGGWLTHGLTLFFVLSGFLLFRPFAASIVDGRPLPSIKKYARNRFLRIYPAYLVILVLAGLVFGAAYTEGPPQNGGVSIGHLTDPLTLAANVLLVQGYIPATLLTGIGPSWSLVPEVAFYVALPLLVLLSARLAQRGRPPLVSALVAPALLVVVGWAVTFYLEHRTAGMSGTEEFQYLWGHHWSAVLARSLLAQADLFGYGMLTAVVVVALARWGVTRAPSVLPPLLFLTAAGLTWAALDGPLESHARRFIGMAAALLVLAVAVPSTSGEPNAGARMLEARPLRYVGLISFSVYLWHVPVLFWLDRHGLSFGDDMMGLLGNIALVFAVTGILSSLTFWLVERPALNAKQRTEAALPEQRSEPHVSVGASA